MSKGEQTRAGIVGKALAQAVELGLENISLGPLADSLEMSKSGLFAHFKSKESLQLAVMSEAIERFKARVVAPALQAEAGEQRLRALFRNYLGWLDGSYDLPGCLFVGAAQEYDDRPGPVRDMLVSSQLAWRELLASSAREAINARQIRKGADADQMAFDLVGVALAYHQTKKLLDDRGAARRAEAAFDRILTSHT